MLENGIHMNFYYATAKIIHAFKLSLEAEEFPAICE